MVMYNYIYIHTAYSHRHIYLYTHTIILKMGYSNQIILVVPPYLINKKSVSSIIIYIQVGEDNICSLKIKSKYSDIIVLNVSFHYTFKRRVRNISLYGT